MAMRVRNFLMMLNKLLQMHLKLLQEELQKVFEATGDLLVIKSLIKSQKAQQLLHSSGLLQINKKYRN